MCSLYKSKFTNWQFMVFKEIITTIIEILSILIFDCNTKTGDCHQPSNHFFSVNNHKGVETCNVEIQ